MSDVRRRLGGRGGLDIDESGEKATNIIQRFANDSDLPRHLVKQTMLTDLNSIFEPDAHFTEILTRRDDGTEEWEIYLVEERKGPIALSQSGSGLKTVLLVLAFVHLLPNTPNRPKGLESWVFGFEELENNLHPALQRRLFSFLRKKAVEDKCTLFITTHSPVVVDLFADDEEAQVVHVTHDGEVAKATPVLSYASRRSVLDDLDLRASDLLQANCVVWVEGPTDRLYFNRWMELWSDGRLTEGRDYQCVFYGGRLLNHLCSLPPGESDGSIEILRVNRNAIILIDSDKGYLRDSINATKKRMVTEVEEAGGYAWVTKGKEIEHYIPAATLRELYPDVTRYPKMTEKLLYSSFDVYLDRLKKGEGKKYLRDKIAFAARALPHLQKDCLNGTLDLADHLGEVTNLIRKWNDLPEPTPLNEGV